MKSLIKIFFITIFFFSPTILFLSGCATSKGKNKQVSQIPWNRPQQWEGKGQLGGIADSMGIGGR